MRADRIQSEAEHIHPFLCHPARRGGGLWFCNIENLCLWQWPENKAKKKKVPTTTEQNITENKRENSSGFPKENIFFTTICLCIFFFMIDGFPLNPKQSCQCPIYLWETKTTFNSFLFIWYLINYNFSKLFSIFIFSFREGWIKCWIF